MNSRPKPLLGVLLLGAPGTGKTQLARDLLSALGGRNPPVQARVTESTTAPDTAAAPGTHILLMGLDLPATASNATAEADQVLRQALAAAGTAYQVIYGSGPERLNNALRALQAGADGENRPAPARLAEGKNASNRASRWVWACDKCSDPACEHRLLSDLLAARKPA